MLKLNNIDIHFGQNHILKDLSCTVNKGDFIVVVGTNGSGKSTLFDTIAGKIKPSHGSIILDGINITALNEQHRSSMITRIFQNTKLNSVGSFTVAQNLALAHYSRRTARLVDGMKDMPHERAQEIIHKLGMPTSILEKKMNSLSGGQRQLIAFAMATQLIPKVLLLDEPTAALDPQAATKLLTYANNFIKQHQITTLLITHDPEMAVRMGNKVWVLENGKITKEFSNQEKQNLDPAKMLGHIDYSDISR